MAVIRGKSINDRLRGTRESDIILGLGGNDTLFGLAGNDNLRGADGNDVMNGGLGNDRMIGGRGDDIYVVNSVGDRTIEGVGQGTDTVQATVTWTLGANIENLTLLGRAAIDGFGNNLNNTIIGNLGNNDLQGRDGDDTLNGRQGADSLLGGNGNDTLIGGEGEDALAGDAGNDTLIGGLDIRTAGTDITNLTQDIDQLVGGLGDDNYYINQADDSVVEDANAGTDKVFVFSTGFVGDSYTLRNNIENLEILGTRGIGAVGNGLDNSITGNAAANNLDGADGSDILNGGDGNDTLVGGNGNDSLTGGTGSDQFLYIVRTDGIDTITDFSRDSDKIVLSRTLFTLNSLAGSGFSVAAEFDAVDTDAAAATSAARVVFSRQSNTLFSNQNGTGSGFGDEGFRGAFATIAGVSTLSASDFVITL
ncbi:calcium-binding protein [Oscillatoria sp. FACHB-1407]|uniref:calcium-binding protein n=1 Tax=Oscillatoria sp. FACHB-1407 TaxID=2692847 RepID=UPI001681C678|nr:calcium-binding protein [Oscillatoria sp. FACHB-1407]MBD2460095.1 calcium-binding protein [Oscillatoria sp. FACHB-1407]